MGIGRHKTRNRDGRHLNDQKLNKSGTHNHSGAVIETQREDPNDVLTLNDLMWEPDIDWRGDAACSGVNSDLFFPATEDESATAQAKEICAECPVQEACLQYALATNQSAGVWGGLDEGDRRRLRRRIRDRDRRKAS